MATLAERFKELQRMYSDEVEAKKYRGKRKWPYCVAGGALLAASIGIGVIGKDLSSDQPEGSNQYKNSPEHGKIVDEDMERVLRNVLRYCDTCILGLSAARDIAENGLNQNNRKILQEYMDLANEDSEYLNFGNNFRINHKETVNILKRLALKRLTLDYIAPEDKEQLKQLDSMIEQLKKYKKRCKAFLEFPKPDDVAPTTAPK